MRRNPTTTNKLVAFTDVLTLLSIAAFSVLQKYAGSDQVLDLLQDEGVFNKLEREMGPDDCVRAAQSVIALFIMTAPAIRYIVTTPSDVAYATCLKKGSLTAAQKGCLASDLLALISAIGFSVYTSEFYSAPGSKREDALAVMHQQGLCSDMQYNFRTLDNGCLKQAMAVGILAAMALPALVGTVRSIANLTQVMAAMLCGNKDPAFGTVEEIEERLNNSV